MGGNLTLARDFNHGVHLVLCHELRHAYQTLFHRGSRSFNAGRYMARASEVDARRHVDENYGAICAFLDVEPMPTGRVSSDVDGVVDMLVTHGDISEDVVWDHVIGMPGDPDVNFHLVVDRLGSRDNASL